MEGLHVDAPAVTERIVRGGEDQVAQIDVEGLLACLAEFDRVVAAARPPH